MTIPEVIITTGFASVIGAVGYLYKNYNAKTDADVIIKRLREEIDDLKNGYKELKDLHNEQIKLNEGLLTSNAGYQKCIHDLEVQVKKLSSQIALLTATKKTTTKK